MIPDEIKLPVKNFLLKNWIIIIILISCIGVGYTSVVFLGKNNPIEQDIEKVIEVETGVKIDLTP